MARKSPIREIKRATKKRFTPDQKIQVVLEGLRGEKTISEICRREGITSVTYYKWSKSFLEAGKNALTLDTKRNATTEEVKVLKGENSDLRRAVSEQMLETIRLKKTLGILV
jgi:transposase-like protein